MPHNPTYSTTSLAVQNGSSSSRASHSYSYPNTQTGQPNSAQETVDRFVRDERDHRSFAVVEYDACQEAARTKHAQALKEVVGKKY